MLGENFQTRMKYFEKLKFNGLSPLPPATTQSTAFHPLIGCPDSCTSGVYDYYAEVLISRIMGHARPSTKTKSLRKINIVVNVPQGRNNPSANFQPQNFHGQGCR